MVLQDGRLTETINLFVPSLDTFNLNTSPQIDQTSNVPPNLQNSTSNPNPQSHRINFSNLLKSSIGHINHFEDLIKGIMDGHKLKEPSNREARRLYLRATHLAASALATYTKSKYGRA